MTSQNLMVPSLCPVIYKFVIFENPVKWGELVCFASEGRIDGRFFATEVYSCIAITLYNNE